MITTTGTTLELVKNMQFEWNARTQITMWFDNTDEEASLLRDYGMLRTHISNLYRSIAMML